MLQKSNYQESINTFRSSVAFHVEISHLICTINQTTGFYMKYNSALKWVKECHKQLFVYERKVYDTQSYRPCQNLNLKNPLTVFA